MRRIFTKIFSVVLFLVCVANANELDGGADAGSSKNGWIFGLDLNVNFSPKLNIVSYHPDYNNGQKTSTVKGQTYGFGFLGGYKFQNHRIYAQFNGYFGSGAGKEEMWWCRRGDTNLATGRCNNPFREDADISYDTYSIVAEYDYTPYIGWDTKLLLGVFGGVLSFDKTLEYPEGATDDEPRYSTTLGVYGAKLGIVRQISYRTSLDFGIKYTRVAGGSYDTKETTDSKGNKVQLREEVKSFGTVGAFLGFVYTF